MSLARTKRKLAAILSAGIKGYSRLMEDDEETTVQTITAYRELMANQINNRNGLTVDAQGDNVQAEFSSIVDAVERAVTIQKELGEENAPLPEHRKMIFRMGVNLGDVIEEGDTLYGDGVNIAARLAEGGGHLCIRDRVKQAMRLKPASSDLVLLSPRDCVPAKGSSSAIPTLWCFTFSLQAYMPNWETQRR